MNNSKETNQDDQRSLLLMDELEAGEPISQREIAGRLGIALGLVNSYLKTLVHKGFIQIKAYPRNRYAYLLTPEGFAEKSRLAYQHVTQFHKLFRTARQDSLELFQRMEAQGATQLSFCGIDEFTEIAYLSLRETELKLVAVLDDELAGERFLDIPVISLADGLTTERHPLVLTSLRHSQGDRQRLLTLGAQSTDIYGPIFGANG
ncbi:MAG: winged helix-turn-helix transcriptional regulator [Desulfoarculaceae bacterium]|nr:winged helix-turn-helix transcriptional regulator [Desulfoarculaceae bacterium]